MERAFHKYYAREHGKFLKHVMKYVDHQQDKVDWDMVGLDEDTFSLHCSSHGLHLAPTNLKDTMGRLCYSSGTFSKKYPPFQPQSKWTDPKPKT